MSDRIKSPKTPYLLNMNKVLKEVAIPASVPSVASNNGNKKPPRTCNKCGKKVYGAMPPHLQQCSALKTKGSSGGKCDNNTSKILADQVGDLVHQVDAAQDMASDAYQEAKELKQDLLEPAKEIKREIEVLELQAELDSLKNSTISPNPLDVTKIPTDGYSPAIYRWGDYTNVSKKMPGLVIGELDQCDYPTAMFHSERADYWLERGSLFALICQFVIGCMTGDALLCMSFILFDFVTHIIYRRWLQTGEMKHGLIIALVCQSVLGWIHLDMNISNKNPFFSSTRSATMNMVCDAWLIVLFIILDFLAYMIYRQWWQPGEKIKHIRLILIEKDQRRITKDFRPEMDRNTPMARQMVKVYNVRVEVRTNLGFRYYKDWMNTLPSQWFKPNGRTLKQVSINDGLLATALNRKTMMAARDHPEVAIDTMTRLVQANPQYQEDYHALLDTGSSIYRDMALICGAIVSRDPYHSNQHF